MRPGCPAAPLAGTLTRGDATVSWAGGSSTTAAKAAEGAATEAGAGAARKAKAEAEAQAETQPEATPHSAETYVFVYKPFEPD